MQSFSWMNKTKLKALFLKASFGICIVIFSLLPGYAQNLRFDHLSVKQGLSQGNVWDIYQDSLGFIWIATEDGLNLYDGYKFTIFRNIPTDSTSISNNNIDNLVEDKHGNFWISTQDGLNYYNRKLNKFIRYKHDPSDPGSISNSDVGYVYVDSQGNVWAGTQGGLNLFNRYTGKFKHFLHDPNDKSSIPDVAIETILEDNMHQLWIGTAIGGLSMLNPDSTTFTNYWQDLGDAKATTNINKIVCLLEDKVYKKNILWIGTFGGGLSKFDLITKTFTNYESIPDDPTTLGNGVVYGLSQDEDGTLWVATDGSLNRMDPVTGIFRRIKQIQGDENSLASNIIVKVYFDNQNRMMVGTRFGGVNIYDKEKYAFQHYRFNSYDANCLNNNNVTALTEDQDGSFWIGTDGGGLNYYDRKTNKFSSYPEASSNPKVLAVEKDDDGGVWTGTWAGGLSYYHPKTKEIRRYVENQSNPRGLNDVSIFDILKDHTGTIWIGTFGSGMLKYSPQTNDFTRYPHNDEDPNSYAGSVLVKLWEDSYGKIWVATEQKGIDEFDPLTGKFTHHPGGTDNGQLSSNSVFSFYEDSKRRLWVGTTGSGLNMLDRETKKFTTYRQKDGLPNDGIMGILEDNQGNIWVSTNKGISRFNPETKVFKNFTESDGLQGDQFNRWSYEKLSTGELIFGGTNGFNMFRPENVKSNSKIPPVYIIDFKIFNKPVPIGENEVLTKNIIYTDEIVLHYWQNVFSFEFAALNYRQTEKNKYKYIMEGFQDEWIESGEERKITYTNLSPGEYTFHVKASNNDGLWNEQGRSIKITIVSPFWKTWWFYTACVVALASGVAGYVNYQKKKSKRQAEELKAIIEERTAEVKQQSAEIIKKSEQESVNNWITQGLALISETISRNNNELNLMSNETLKSVVKYINAQQGVLALGVKDEPADEHLKIFATYGVSIKNKIERIEIGSGMLGETYKDKEKKTLNHVPANYIKIESGLGQAAPANIILLPLKTDDGDIVGVMELAFLGPISDTIQTFLDKVSSLIALNIVAVTLAHKSFLLLQQSTQQAEEMRAQEEEMRQNMEELEATQDEYRRREGEYQRRIDDLEASLKKDS